MAWIESHQSLAHHPKTLRLAAALKCGVPAAIGYVHLLWYWALDYAPEGIIATDMRDQVAQACEWRGKPETFWLGLLHAGFIESTDAGIRIHDWMDYAGRLVDKRNANRVRSERARNAKRAHTEREANAATNQPTGEGIKPSPSPTNPQTPLHDADAHGGSAPRVGSQSDAPNDVAVIHAEAGVCPLCRLPYLGSYLDHTSEKHAVRPNPGPGNLGQSFGRHRVQTEPTPPEVEARLAQPPLQA